MSFQNTAGETSDLTFVHIKKHKYKKKKHLRHIYSSFLLLQSAIVNSEVVFRPDIVK